MGRLVEVDYEKIFSPETMASLKGKSGESLKQMLGNKKLMQTLVRSKAVLDEIITAEDGYRDELEMVAAQMVTDAYPIIDYANIKIEAEIVGMDNLDIQTPPPQEDPTSPDFGGDDPEKLKAKRRIINGITQGASIRGKAKAICFPMLVHEIVKGLYEIVGTEGFGADREKNQAIVGAVDTLANEPRDLQYGKFIYDAISKIYNESNIDDARVRELFFAEVYKLIDDEFFPFIENAINNKLQPLQKKWAMDTMRDIERDLKKDDTGLADLDETL